ncbi:MAG: M42 family metallopeptidase [Anaerolineales bacterium]
MGPKQPKLNLPPFGAAQIRLLEKLSNAVAVSGDEGEVRQIILENIRQHVDEVRVDALGNVLAIRHAAQESRMKVMVAAHMDEVGLMLTSEEDKEEAFFRFEIIGGIDPRYLAGKTVQVGRPKKFGVIGSKPIHLTSAEERKKALDLESLRIDLSGAAGKAQIGDRGTFATLFQTHGDYLRGKALDDRLGVAILIELLKHPFPQIDLLAAFTVQEEVGLRGAKVAAYTLNPDAALVLDCTPAYDTPLERDDPDHPPENVRYNTKLGVGAAIYLADRETLSDPRWIAHLVQTAENNRIPYQFRQPGGGGTDAGSIHLQRSGIPTVSLSTPGRYIHTPASIASFSDWKNTFYLSFLALQHLTPEVFNKER